MRESLFIISFVAAVFGLIVGIIYLGSSYECAAYQRITSKQTQMGGLTCYIQDGGKWYGWPEYKYRLATKGEMPKE